MKADKGVNVVNIVNVASPVNVVKNDGVGLRAFEVTIIMHSRIHGLSSCLYDIHDIHDIHGIHGIHDIHDIHGIPVPYPLLSHSPYFPILSTPVRCRSSSFALPYAPYGKLRGVTKPKQSAATSNKININQQLEESLIRSHPLMNGRRQLADLLMQEREKLLTCWRKQVKDLPSARPLDTPTLNDHVPQFIVELAGELRSGSEESIPEAVEEAQGSASHGLQRFEDGFDIVEVVAEYNILRACIHDLAAQHGIVIQGEMFNVVNRLLDTAIGSAVQHYATAQALAVQRRREEHLAFIAHDLRTPLNAIAMIVRLLEHPRSAAQDTVSLFKTLTRNIEHLSNLVNEVLKENADLVTEVGVKLEPRWFDLWPLVESLIHELRPIAGTGSTALRNEIPAELRIHADASLLTRVFQNLIANAIAHTPRGEVAIGATLPGPDDKMVECWVRDNGSGISAERLAHVFEKYETDQVQEHGAGLGLAIVKMFVEAHGGEVAAESVQGSGSTFRIRLPFGRRR